MSSITLDEIAEVSRNRLGWAPNTVPRLKTLVPISLKSLAYKVAQSEERQELVKIIQKAPTAGVIDLSHADFAGVILDTFRFPTAITTSVDSAKVFSHVASMNKLRATTPADPNYVWYHMRGLSLVFKNPATGALNTYAEALKLAGSYIPTLLEMPAIFDKKLIDEVVMHAEGKGQSDLKIDLGSK